MLTCWPRYSCHPHCFPLNKDSISIMRLVLPKCHIAMAFDVRPNSQWKHIVYKISQSELMAPCSKSQIYDSGWIRTETKILTLVHDSFDHFLIVCWRFTYKNVQLYNNNKLTQQTNLSEQVRCDNVLCFSLRRFSSSAATDDCQRIAFTKTRILPRI